MDTNEYFKGEFRIEFTHSQGQDNHRTVRVDHAVYDHRGKVVYLFDIYGKLYNFDHVISMYKIGDIRSFNG